MNDYFKNRKVVSIIAVAVAVIVLIGAFSYMNSAALLEKKLENGNWTYISVWLDGSEWRTNAKVKFYSDGTVSYTYSDGSGGSYNWELLEDKTMIFDGDYYDYGEWYCSGGEVVIGKYFKCTENPDKYPER